MKKRNCTTLWVRLLKIGIFWKVINFFNFLLDGDVQPSTRKAGLCGTFTQQLMNTALTKTAQFRARFGCRMPGLLQPKVKHHGEVLGKWQSFITRQTGLMLGLTSQKNFGIAILTPWFVALSRFGQCQETKPRELKAFRIRPTSTGNVLRWKKQPTNQKTLKEIQGKAYSPGAHRNLVERAMKMLQEFH